MLIFQTCRDKQLYRLPTICRQKRWAESVTLPDYAFVYSHLINCLYVLTQLVIILHMIKTFANKETAAVFAGERPRRLPLNVLSVAIRKIAQLDAVQSVNELSVPPGNRLEKLSGARQGQYSIRINDQWRLCFRFVEGNDVEMVDYH